MRANDRLRPYRQRPAAKVVIEVHPMRKAQNKVFFKGPFLYAQIRNDKSGNCQDAANEQHQ